MRIYTRRLMNQKKHNWDTATHKLRVGMNHVGDTLTHETLLTETPFDIVQNFGMGSVRLIEDVFEGEIRGAEAVAEVLRKDPATVWSLLRNEGHRRERKWDAQA
jgi:hypothetical protein